jgi:hypothetical protein
MLSIRGPIPSSELIASQSGRKPRRLVPWAVNTLGVPTHTAHGWFLGYARGEKLSPAWGMGADLLFWRRAMELAGAMVVRQQFLPAVLETREIPGRWWPCWTPTYEAEDLRRLEVLAGAMPTAARALSRDRHRRPQREPRLLVRDFVTDMVDHLVTMAEINDSMWEHFPRDQRRRKPVHLHERWLETLLTPDLELKGVVPELIALQGQTDAWRDAVFVRPPIEDVYPAPAISLPTNGEDFWKGPELPDDFVGPVETPLDPGLVLRRVGEIPSWRGDRMLRDSLEPVYEAASRYALEYVFDRKQQARHLRW